MSFLARREANAGRPPENLEGFRRRGDSRVVELKGERHCAVLGVARVSARADSTRCPTRTNRRVGGGCGCILRLVPVLWLQKSNVGARALRQAVSAVSFHLLHRS
jgi:hypothetical protein